MGATLALNGLIKIIDNSVKIHIRYLQVLVTEMFKLKSGVALSLLEEVFQFANSIYDLGNKKEL